VNIPTGELAEFAPDEQGTPPVSYAREASLDPELVWRGKDRLAAADRRPT
jgi:adenine-specific DNA-methyltransferase